MSVRPHIGSTRLLAVILVTICIVVISIDYRQGETGPLESVGRVAVGVIAPVQEAVSKVTQPIGNFISALTSLPSLKRENETLKQERDALEQRVATQADAEAEVVRLEALLGMKDSIDREAVTARVIANGVSNLEWTITIDKGEADGIKVNDAVLASRGVVGRVIRVTGGASQVQLIVDPNEGVTGVVELPDGTTQQGVVLGEGDQNMTMDLLNPETPTKDLINQPVTTVGYAIGGRTNLYPRDVNIGTVVRVLESAGELAKQVEVAPAVDLSAIDTVLVVRQPEGI